MPQNCSADVQAVISHIDTVFTSGQQSETDQIKELFGLSELTHLDDVAGARKSGSQIYGKRAAANAHTFSSP